MKEESVKNTSALSMASPLSSSNATNAAVWLPITVQETRTFAHNASKILNVWASSIAEEMNGSAHLAGGMLTVPLYLLLRASSAIAKESEFS